ncbi:hypothetical protein AB0G60_02665 [Streptomyces angustmyceticus]|uniref:Uncharacterized protein n=1 Tax=Streptomyces angustmyceticus TaxID=285578 RepID=A0A5J4LCV8_9ACTN|nr:hypothetical protein [Streptomyces angustmyceticus]UAL65566.1 hypothetical protein K7396_02640 [Streptomyces angustmyceticus]GES27915.1 hypothetical protein San01_04020 [Streptomyces angustmyceticus]
MTDTARCAANHPDDKTPCDDGPRDAVTVLDAEGAGATGCEHHSARLLASLDGGRVYPSPNAPESAAIRVHKAAGFIDPFPWHDNAPRRRVDQLSAAANSRCTCGRTVHSLDCPSLKHAPTA